ncbi:hypothetical protein ASG42_28525 [Rhizobium sp. Leaf391]|uniref:hypothetical protein n=1 Tax=Rhizobium sp. Leaf391 TaxID=1736360 RepID=UPI0007145670|nr:hypothetical protein [Rhizobium sp. Leaf391]KQS96833.1 hypothetical protein ASG42_28525 [Rhizobium sp. Leaf391]
MNDAPKLGEPIPLGIISTDTAVLGQADAVPLGDSSAPEEAKSTADQIKALKAEIATLKDLIATTGKIAATKAGAHPYIMTTAISLVVWTLISIAYRRSDHSVSDVYGGIRSR